MNSFDRIRLEETYRAKIKNKLDASKRKSSSILEFFNTNFGLFILSTVFISIFSWSFNTFLTHEHEISDANKSRQKLGLEIMNRLTYVDELKDRFPYNEWHAIETAVTGFTVNANVNPSWIPHYGAVFPEYQARSLISLIWELDTLVDAPKRKQLQEARIPISKLRAFFNKLEYAKTEAPNRNPEGKLETLGLSPANATDFENDVAKQLAFLKNAKFYEGR